MPLKTVNLTTHPLSRAQKLMTHYPLSAPANPPPPSLIRFDQSLSRSHPIDLGTNYARFGLDKTFHIYSGIPILRTSEGKENWFEKSGVKLVRKIGGKKSGVKLQCLTEEGKRLLANYREVKKIEGLRSRDSTAPFVVNKSVAGGSRGVEVAS